MPNFYPEYLAFLKEHANKERAIKEKAYLYSNLKHYGVSTWERRQFYRQYQKQILALSKADTLSLVNFYWSKDSFEERSFALDILNLHIDKLTLVDMPLIEKLMRESGGWVYLDNLIIPIMPTLLTKYPQGYAYLNKWIKDDDFWVRRSALLAQILFFRSNQGGDKDLFFKLAISQFDESWLDEKYPDPLMKKRAKFFIRKAIGWAIREISAKDPQTAFNFFKEYKHQMSGLSFRDGRRKLPRELQIKLFT